MEIRYAARIVAIDPQHRILLFGYRSPFTGEEFWVTPGGGREADETDLDAARREFFEETGFEAPVDLGPVVWTRTHTFAWGGRWIEQREAIFHLRVQSMEIGPAHVASLTPKGIIGHRWFTLDELRDPSAPAVAPRRLAALLEELQRDGPSDVAIDVSD